jgi:hypothetical protein
LYNQPDSQPPPIKEAMTWHPKPQIKATLNNSIAQAIAVNSVYISFELVLLAKNVK